MSFHRIRNQICATVVALSIVLMSHGVCGRPELGAFTSYIERQGMPSPQVLLDELRARANEDALYSELKKYHRQQPNYISQWPTLRDLLQTADYDDANALESAELANSRFVERLRQLAASTADLEDIRDENKLGMAGQGIDLAGTSGDAGAGGVSTASPFKGARVAFKDHDTKKNVQMFRKQYMSPCHFKICNMGRKRNARYMPF